eukprot:m.49692 g.49692  ORF g.49692 m.49692 type:complete len:106 (-) comp7464_c2_seq7:89-406(-)
MNDSQFIALSNAIQLSHLPKDVKFATNERRVENRDELVQLLCNQLETKSNDEWCDVFDTFASTVNSGMFSFGPINSVTQAFSDKQVWQVGSPRIPPPLPKKRSCS